MKIAVCTLGCKTNQFECQAMEKLFAERGYDVVPQDCEADAYVVNSCTVTATADKKTRQLIRHLKRLHPHAFVAVCGCMVQTGLQDLKTICGADMLGGNRDYEAFVRGVDEALSSRMPPHETLSAGECGFMSLPAGGLHGRTRALLKVEDGCENFCTYCIIPFARGKIRSMRLEDAEAQTRALCAQGFREIVLTGIEISAYGSDLTPKHTLCDLVECVCKAAGETRISLGSLKPTIIDDAFCERLSKMENLCRHFHLSMQSGCTETLRRMNRHYTAEDVVQAVERLRHSFDDPNITADIIVGFPGETDDEFQQTMQTLERCRLGDAHIFPYSVRKGTAAAKMPNQILSEEKRARSAACAARCKQLRDEYLANKIGTLQTVLPEEERNGLIGGYTDQYLYVILTPSPSIVRGTPLQVRITGQQDGELIGVPI